MINFDRLPTSIGTDFAPLPEGEYEAKIMKAEMRTPQDPRKPDYLSVQWGVFENGKRTGTVFDIMTESEKAIPLYKLRCLIEAMGLNLTRFELKDLTKVLPGKRAMINIEISKDNNGNDRNAIKVIGLAAGEKPYRAIEEDTAEDEDLPFAMGDEPLPYADEY